MTDPLALAPLALAAAGGRVGAYPVAALVAAGYTLLQRSAVLVRALSGRRSAILLPPGSAALTALAASDGRGALLLSPGAVPPAALGALLRQEHVGALFTVRALRGALADAAAPPDLIEVWLDEAPARATVVANGQARPLDLGSHFGLDLAGDPTIDGLAEPFVWIDGTWYTHQAVLRGARALAERVEDRSSLSAVHEDWSHPGLLGEFAVLLGGGALVDRHAGHGAESSRGT